MLGTTDIIHQNNELLFERKAELGGGWGREPVRREGDKGEQKKAEPHGVLPDEECYILILIRRMELV